MMFHLEYLTFPISRDKQTALGLESPPAAAFTFAFRDGGFAAACHVPHHRRMEFCADSTSIADITSDLCGGQQHNARAAQSTALSLLEHDHDDARR